MAVVARGPRSAPDFSRLGCAGYLPIGGGSHLRAPVKWQTNNSRNRFASGALAPSHGKAGSGKESSIMFHGSPSGTRRTAASGSRSLPNRPNVPIANRASTGMLSLANTTTATRQARFTGRLSKGADFALYGPVTYSRLPSHNHGFRYFKPLYSDRDYK